MHSTVPGADNSSLHRDMRVTSNAQDNKKVAAHTGFLFIKLIGPLSMCVFRRAEKLLACSCVDPFPLLCFRAQVNFSTPEHMGCVYRLNAHDLAEVNMASMDEELFLLLLHRRQRNQLNRMRLTLLAHKSHYQFIAMVQGTRVTQEGVFFH